MGKGGSRKKISGIPKVMAELDLHCLLLQVLVYCIMTTECKWPHLCVCILYVAFYILWPDQMKIAYDI